MTNNEQLVKDLTAKDEAKAVEAARAIVDGANVEAFKMLADKSEFLFDFVKNNVNKRLQKVITKDNYQNLKAFLKVYSPDFEDTIVEAFAKNANEDLTDEMLELLENGTDAEKTYSAKYFTFIPDTISADMLIDYALSDNDNEALAFNSAKALGEMKIAAAYDKALELLHSDDEFTVLKAVKFLIAFEDKNAVRPILAAMEKSSMSENIAGEIPYLTSLLELLETDKEVALRAIDNILAGLGEILPLNQIFCFEMFEVLNHLIERNKHDKDSQASAVLLRALNKFEEFEDSDEYTFDEDKNTKQELSAIFNLLKKQQEYFWNAQKSLVTEELTKSANRIISAIRVISEYKIVSAEEKLKAILDGEDEILICEAAGALKHLDKLQDVDKDALLAKIKDDYKKAIVANLF